MIQRINLIPEELKEKKVLSKLPMKYILVLLLAAVYIVPTHLVIAGKIKDAGRRVIELEKKKLGLVTNNMKFVKLKEETESLSKEIKLAKKVSASLKKVVDGRISWSDILKEVSYMVPEKLWLNTLESIDTVQKAKAKESGKNGDKPAIETIKTIIITGTSYSSSRIKDFIRELEGSYYFDDVTLKYVKKRVISGTHTVYDFEAVSKLKDLSRQAR